MRSWEKKLAACLFGFALGIALGMQKCRAAETTLELVNPMCPGGVYVGQRYDSWRRVGGRLTIVKSRWIRRCITMPAVRYH